MNKNIFLFMVIHTFLIFNSVLADELVKKGDKATDNKVRIFLPTTA